MPKPDWAEYPELQESYGKYESASPQLAIERLAPGCRDPGCCRICEGSYDLPATILCPSCSSWVCRGCFSLHSGVCSYCE
jgi:hypothetical protein